MPRGIDCLKEELAKMGFSKSQIESKVVPAVLAIVAQDKDLYCNIEAEREELHRLADAIDNLKAVWHSLDDQCEVLKKKRDALQTEYDEAFNAAYVQAKHYIQSFNESLQQCETPEGRDAMKRAQVFVNSVSIDTPANNTAFIAGLATILTDGAFSYVDKLQKVEENVVERKKNPKSR